MHSMAVNTRQRIESQLESALRQEALWEARLNLALAEQAQHEAARVIAQVEAEQPCSPNQQVAR